MSTTFTVTSKQETLLVFFFLVVETSFLYPLYSLLDTGLRDLFPLSPETSLIRLPLLLWLIPIIISFIVKIALKKRTPRLWWLVVINGLIWGVSLIASLQYVLPLIYRDTNALTKIGLFLATAWGPSNLLRFWLITLFFVWNGWRTHLFLRRPLNYKQTISHFEISLAVLFGIFLIASLTDLIIPGGLTWLLITFASNSGALGLASVADSPVDDWRFPWLGPLFLLSLLVPLMLIFPHISTKISSSAATTIAASLPLLNWIKGFSLLSLIWLLKLGHLVPQESSIQSSNTRINNPPIFPALSEQTWLNVIINLLSRFTIVLIILLVTLLILFLVYRQVRSLWNNRQTGSLSPSDWNFRTWWKRYRYQLIFWLNGVWIILTYSLPGKPRETGITQAYQALLYWGERQKHPRFSFETPCEYCGRLTKSFPKLANNFLIITETYILHFYGARHISSRANREVFIALRHLYADRHLTRKSLP